MFFILFLLVSIGFLFREFLGKPVLSTETKEAEPTEPASFTTVGFITLEDDPAVESSITSYMQGTDLIIEYNNPNNEQVWIEGLDNDRYEIKDSKDKIVVYDYGGEFKLW